MRHASYKYGVQWIALNDEPSDYSVDSISTYISVLLLADLFQVEPQKVARDILKLRQNDPIFEAVDQYEKIR